MFSLNVAGGEAGVDTIDLETAAMHHVMEIGLANTIKHKTELPCGAVATRGAVMIGKGVPTDFRLMQDPLHAEFNAGASARLDPTYRPVNVYDSEGKVVAGPPDTFRVGFEPCDNCQDWLATQPGIKRVAFILSRVDLANKGLVKPHPETIFERVERLGFPYTVEQLQDEELRGIGLSILDHVQRNPKTEVVTIKADPLKAILSNLRRKPVSTVLLPARRFA